MIDNISYYMIDNISYYMIDNISYYRREEPIYNRSEWRRGKSLELKTRGRGFASPSNVGDAFNLSFYRRIRFNLSIILWQRGDEIQ